MTVLKYDDVIKSHVALIKKKFKKKKNLLNFEFARIDQKILTLRDEIVWKYFFMAVHFQKNFQLHHRAWPPMQIKKAYTKRK